MNSFLAANQAAQLDTETVNSFYIYLNNLFLHRIVPIAIIGGIFMFAVGGILIIFSGGNAEKISTGKEIITGTIIGLILILLAQVILASIDSNLSHVFIQK